MPAMTCEYTNHGERQRTSHRSMAWKRQGVRSPSAPPQKPGSQYLSRLRFRPRPTWCQRSFAVGVTRAVADAGMLRRVNGHGRRDCHVPRFRLRSGVVAPALPSQFDDVSAGRPKRAASSGRPGSRRSGPSSIERVCPTVQRAVRCAATPTRRRPESRLCGGCRDSRRLRVLRPTGGRGLCRAGGSADRAGRGAWS